MELTEVVLLDARLWSEHVRSQPMAADTRELFDCDAVLGRWLAGLNPARDRLRLLAEFQGEFPLRLGRQAFVGDFNGFHADS